MSLMYTRGLPRHSVKQSLSDQLEKWHPQSKPFWQPVIDETLASSEGEDTDISDVASETDNSVVEDSNQDYETYSSSSSGRSSDMEEEITSVPSASTEEAWVPKNGKVKWQPTPLKITGRLSA
ncbi:hypothetical protein T08_4218 [Trichinella sp. T8]|nr:hypothetical protein T08_4218 [Trichinella sp. T8]